MCEGEGAKAPFGLLLDCDGVIVDSEPLNFHCWNLAFQQHFGVSSRLTHHALLGRDLRGIVELWCPGGLSPEDIARVRQTKHALYFQHAVEWLHPVPGIARLIAQARALSWGIAVVSAGDRPRLLLNLERAGVRGLFDVIVSQEDFGGAFAGVLKDYSPAVQRLAIPASRCLVIEDSEGGIEAARAVGAGRVLGIATYTDPQRLLARGADRVIFGYDELDLSIEAVQLDKS